METRFKAPGLKPVNLGTGVVYSPSGLFNAKLSSTGEGREVSMKKVGRGCWNGLSWVPGEDAISIREVSHSQPEIGVLFIMQPVK